MRVLFAPAPAWIISGYLKKRQRTAALQDADASSKSPQYSARSWSAAVLRFYNCNQCSRALALAASLLATAQFANAQANLPIYTDHLVNGFQDWSWAPRNMGGTTALHTGTNSIAVTPNNFGDGVSFHQSAFNTSVYTALSFWANGGTNGGQTLDVYMSLNDVDQSHYNLSPALPANTWQQYVVPLGNLSAANKTKLPTITIPMLCGYQ